MKLAREDVDRELRLCLRFRPAGAQGDRNSDSVAIDAQRCDWRTPAAAEDYVITDVTNLANTGTVSAAPTLSNGPRR